MNQKNIGKVLSAIKDNYRVLDVGGWAQPLKRANAVIDIFPYETRGKFGSIGEGQEQFTKSDWYGMDICDRKPWPFKDKEFDFVLCSHTLEDLRDPIWICSEMTRVGKMGYIETPSRAAEILMGVESYKYPGCLHHRWLVEYENGKLTFLYKTPLLLYNLRISYFIYTEPVIGFFWKDKFEFGEKTAVEFKEKLERELDLWISQYRLKMPLTLRILDYICPFLPMALTKKIQKLCRYIWQLPKV